MLAGLPNPLVLLLKTMIHAVAWAIQCRLDSLHPLQICETSPKPDGSCKSEGGGERVDMEARFETHFPGGWKGGACWSLAWEVEMQGFLFCGPGRFSRDSEFIQEGTVQLSGSLLS